MPEVKFPSVVAVVRFKGSKLGELTVDEAKELIGWTEEPQPKEGEKAGKGFADDFVLKDKNGVKIRLTMNPSNRPYTKGQMEQVKREFLGQNWQPNGETFIFDRYGFCHDGQHRLVAFILASQEDKKVKTMPAILIQGISEKPEVVDTINIGKPRSLADVLFRNREFGKKLKPKEQKGLVKVFAIALRLVWLRMSGSLVQGGGKFHHSEALSLAERHPFVKDCVTTVHELDSTEDNKNLISGSISLGYAAGLCYLMATAKTKEGADEPDLTGAQVERTKKFWKQFASGESKGTGDVFHSLKSVLAKISASGAMGRDEICGAVVKAFQLWQEDPDQQVTPKMLTLKKKKNDKGKFILAESPRLGGLDREVAPETEAAAEVVEETTEEQAAEELAEAVA